jgi:hypothetical protein
MIALRVLAFVLGLVVVGFTIGSALRTVILPRGIPARIGRFVFTGMRILFRLRAGRRPTYERRDRVMALYAPTSLLALLVTWMTLVVAGYTGMYLAFDGRSVRTALTLSGSSIYTLGFERPGDLPSVLLTFTEAALGLTLLALLITYLPSIYAAFSRRELAVALLEVRAGSPPSGAEMLWRFSVLGRAERLADEVWLRWEEWFSDVEESHTSFPALVFFRSPQPDHSWLTAAGAVLDGASLAVSTLDMERDVQAELCIRAGYIALRRIAAFFGIPFDSDPRPDDPITIARSEFDAVYDRLAEGGVPVKLDRDKAWRDFAGWRVNYDTVLIALAGLTMAPFAPWSSDRSLRDWRPPLVMRRARREDLAARLHDLTVHEQDLDERSADGGSQSADHK